MAAAENIIPVPFAGKPQEIRYISCQMGTATIPGNIALPLWPMHGQSGCRRQSTWVHALIVGNNREGERMRTGIFLMFLLIAASQDLCKKRIKVWVFAIFGAIALAADLYLWSRAGKGFLWQSHLWSCGVGMCLLLLGRICGGSIGEGDGAFFLVSGLMLEFWQNLTVFCMGVMLCGFYSLCLFVWSRIRTGRNAGKRTVPFLPFAVLPGVWVAVENGFLR